MSPVAGNTYLYYVRRRTGTREEHFHHGTEARAKGALGYPHAYPIGKCEKK